MSSHGATHKGPPPRKKRPKRFVGQRNRKTQDRRDGQLSSMTYDELQAFVRKCRGKIAHRTYGAAGAAKLASEKKYPGKKFHIYECPVCNRFHLTTHPWRLR